MLGEETTLNLLQEDRQYYTKEEKIQFLSERIAMLEAALADKEKIIALLEAELQKKKKS
jgi:nicotinic acid mononucleotide adenylyltransferase